ncbi:hypothetical protein KY290_027404 [Solanum tuberosum]|uniref:Retrovirus-related Pol polyprotein from transposon TNT 1-94-like beta-barrel domain-containing protein n=1 Tax=Solanum tuberosum TaxID=4113 RepID=A0ABQ7UF15_SOLTU|nr:hypothetical protein KY290_027404 [Solanum tuberosum]
MCLKSAKSTWDYLKAEYEGDERIRGSRTTKSHERRRKYLGSIVCQASRWRQKKKKNKKNGEGISASTTKGKSGYSKKSYPPCKHCNKKGHPSYKCWRRPDARCSKCNQLGHEAVICKNNGQQQEAEAQIVDGEEKDQLFVATCFSNRSLSECWLIDSGCTNHMKNDMSLFKKLKPTTITTVRIGNGDHLLVRGKGTIAIPSYSGYKLNFENNHCLIKDASDQ